MEKYLQSKEKVNKMTMIGAVPNISTGKFKEQRNNIDEKINEAGLLRLPVAEPEDYWEKVPLKREPLFRNIPLNHCGEENLVNEL